ncbi:hypothetical protein M116_3177 [Bacteroides fragilis str. 3719 A10]|nr:hypothetical protein M116_3177 [Bacteroides fragilis str. 3719 A10]
MAFLKAASDKTRQLFYFYSFPSDNFCILFLYFNEFLTFAPILIEI